MEGASFQLKAATMRGTGPAAQIATGIIIRHSYVFMSGRQAPSWLQVKDP